MTFILSSKDKQLASSNIKPISLLILWLYYDSSIYWFLKLDAFIKNNVCKLNLIYPFLVIKILCKFNYVYLTSSGI